MIAEATPFGKPVVATRVGGIPELVAHEQSGYLVERGNTAEAAEKLLRLLQDSDLRHRMGEQGRRIVLSKFCLQQNVRQLLSSYGF